MKKLLHIFFIIAIAVSALALTGVDACKNQPTQGGGGDTTTVPPTNDTTSHNFTWQVDTIGDGGQLNDVAIISDSDVWAVGEIYLKDSTGALDEAHPYNAAHWDGNQWTLKRIFWDSTTNGIGKLTAIYAFGDNDIWVDYPAHWDGHTWRQNFDGLPQILNGAFAGLWGTSSTDIYLTETDGHIWHWNGINFTSIPTGTTSPLLDIYGASDADIYACTSTPLLWYNGSSWQTLIGSYNYGTGYDSTQLYKTQLLGALLSCYKDDKRILYVAGTFIYQYKNGTWSFVSGIPNNNPNATNADIWQTRAGIHMVRGNGWNDLTLFGEMQTLIHYNGSTWQDIGPGYRYLCGTDWDAGAMKGNFIVGVGRSNTGPVAIRLQR